MAAYYNEIDPFAAQWLRNLIAAGHIAAGDVDERSISDVTPDDLRGYTQCHFFAGIGGWSYALRIAGWPDDQPVWTGSCPCQPFSAAGKGDGFTDERHLWPAFHWLIANRRPAVVFGEQVSSPEALQWLDLVFSDMEGEGYACRAEDRCAASVGAPHIRQRLFWVAHAAGKRCHGQQVFLQPGPERQDCTQTSGCGATGIMGDTLGAGLERHPRHDGGQNRWTLAAGSTAPAGLHGHGMGNEPLAGFWRGCDWISCRDGKWRPVESGTFPLVDRATCRVGKLRAYGNCIVPQVAAEFIKDMEHFR